MGRIKINERIGTVNKNRFNKEMIVCEYNNAIDIMVKFINTDEDMIHTTWQSFCKGGVKSVYDKTVHGVGYIGKGIYKVSEKCKYTPQYISWNRMMQRCYDQKLKERNPTYKDCTVAEEWHNYQNFAQWYDENYYEVEGERMHLDKDILIKGNKLYSPETCMFVPQRINMLFVKSDAKRGKFPIGVCQDNETKRYIARCVDVKQKSVGTYCTPEEAFYAYKIYKEKYIKQIAEEYKDKIPTRLYESMLNYSVSILD
jgi:hypothetical protein